MRLGERVPVEVSGNYVICFEPFEMYEDMVEHLVQDCGWERAEAEALDCLWFGAEVSIWRDGVALASEHLGACMYDTYEDFLKCGYYADMRGALLAYVGKNPD